MINTEVFRICMLKYTCRDAEKWLHFIKNLSTISIKSQSPNLSVARRPFPDEFPKTSNDLGI